MNTYQKEVLFASTKKSKLLAYILGAILGGFGVHKFYLGAHAQGFAYLALLFGSLIFPPLLLIIGIYFLVDLFYTSILCDQINALERQRIESLGE